MYSSEYHELNQPRRLYISWSNPCTWFILVVLLALGAVGLGIAIQSYVNTQNNLIENLELVPNPVSKQTISIKSESSSIPTKIPTVSKATQSASGLELTNVGTTYFLKNTGVYTISGYNGVIVDNTNPHNPVLSVNSSFVNCSCTGSNSSSATTTLSSAGSGQSLVQNGVGPGLIVKSLGGDQYIDITSNANSVLFNLNTSAIPTTNYVAGTGISFTGTNPVTISNTDPGSAVSLASSGSGASLVDSGTGPALLVKSLLGDQYINVIPSSNSVSLNFNVSALNFNVTVTNTSFTAGSGIAFIGSDPTVIQNTDPGSAVSLSSGGSGQSLVENGVGPSLIVKSIIGDNYIQVTSNTTTMRLTFNSSLISVNSSCSGGCTNYSAGSGIAFTGTNPVVISNAMTLSSAGGTISLVSNGVTQPNLSIKGLVSGSGVTLTDNGGYITVSANSSATGQALVVGGYVPSWSQYWYANSGGRPNIAYLNQMEYTFANVYPQNPTLELDIIYFAFMGFTVNTITNAVTIIELTVNDAYDIGDINQISGITAQNENAIKVVALGGWNFGATPWQTLIANSARINNFAVAVNNFITANQIQGVDLDWENPFTSLGTNGTAEVIGLSQIITALKTTNPNMFVTYGMPPNYVVISNLLNASLPGTSSASNIIKTQLNYINLYGYDIHGPWETTTGPAAGVIDVTALVDATLSTGIASSKILLGIPAYGHTWTTTLTNSSVLPANPYGISGPSAGPQMLVTIEAGLLDYNELVAIQTWRSPTTYGTYAVSGYDSTTESAYMWFLPDTTLCYTGTVLPNPPQWVLASYDNQNVVKLKMDMAKNRNLGGVYIWHLAADTFYKGNPILTTICENKFF